MGEVRTESGLASKLCMIVNWRRIAGQFGEPAKQLLGNLAVGSLKSVTKCPGGPQQSGQLCWAGSGAGKFQAQTTGACKGL